MARDTRRTNLVLAVWGWLVLALLAAPFASAPAPGTSLPRSTGETWTEPVTGMEFVRVPAGCFQLRSEKGSLDEQTVHRVCVKGFWLGKYEVTQGQWQRVMGSNPAYFKKGDAYPVEMVSWNDAQAFIGKLNGRGQDGFRLPSEAEWTYACHSGGRAETYCGGEDFGSLAWYKNNSGGTTHPVGRKQANGLGLHDMSGNVWEWMQDCYHESDEGTPEDGSAWEDDDCAERVARGGSYHSNPLLFRSRLREGGRPAHRTRGGGLRFAKDL